MERNITKKQVLSGPDLTNLLIGVSIRFRIVPIAVMVDIEKMFYQVNITTTNITT